jgi:putative sigma-54 modulation protein
MVDVRKFKQEDSQDLEHKVHILGRSVLVTEGMKNYLLEKLAKIERFHDHIMEVHVTMDIQHLEHSVVIIVKFDHFKVKVQAGSSDMYASIDEAVRRLEEKVRRWKDKIQDHSKKKLSVVDMRVNVISRPFTEEEEINQEIEAETSRKKAAVFAMPKVIGSEVRKLKTLLVEEAMMKIELSGDQFILFRDEKDRKLKVMYRRKDGNYGIIEAE